MKPRMAFFVCERAPCRKLLLFVDRVSTFVGHAFSWLIVGLTVHRHLGGVLALRARRTRTPGRST